MQEKPDVLLKKKAPRELYEPNQSGAATMTPFAAKADLLAPSDYVEDSASGPDLDNDAFTDEDSGAVRLR